MIPRPTGEFSLIEVDGMRELIHSMTDAHRDLREATGELHAGMASAGMSTARLHDVDRIADWVDSCLPDLRRRLSLASELARHVPDGTPVRIDEEDLLTTDAAEERGHELARILEADGTDQEKLARLGDEIVPHLNDPDVMESFFTGLGIEKTQLLPAMIEQSRHPQGRRLLALFSQGLATAISVPYPSSDLLAIRQAFSDEPKHPEQAWTRMALLQDGRFPPVWLADAVRTNALDEFVGDADFPDQNGHAKLRLSGSRFALAFSALRHNPAAARRALDNPEYTVKDYVQRVYRTSSLDMCQPDISRAFGLALEAAAQADTAREDRDAAAETFTFHFITESTEHHEVPSTMLESLERIGAAYVLELAAGSFADSGSEGAGVEPSLTTPNDFPVESGVEPAFFLTPIVTLRFIGSFQRSSATAIEHVGPFSEAIGAQFERLLDDAIVADLADGGIRTPAVMRLLGGLNKLDFLARREYAVDFEAEQEQFRSKVAMVFGGLLSLPSFGHFMHLLWGAAQNVTNHALGNWAESDGKLSEQLAEQHEKAERILWFFLVERLLDHGVGADALSTAPESLLDGAKLRPIGEILADGELRREFYDWVNENDALDDAADEANEAWSIGVQSASGAVAGISTTNEG